MRFNLKRVPDTVDAIVGQFKETVDKLRVVSDREAKASEDKLQQAAALRREADVHYSEAQRAAKIAANIEKLVS